MDKRNFNRRTGKTNVVQEFALRDLSLNSTRSHNFEKFLYILFYTTLSQKNTDRHLIVNHSKSQKFQDSSFKQTDFYE